MSIENVSDLEEGDDVLVRMRENGQLVAKFLARVDDVEDVSRLMGPKIKLDTPWSGVHPTIRLAPYEAEFERVDEADDVSF
jgi:hypothetical protein